MEATFAPGFKKELPSVLAQVFEDLGQMLDLELGVDTGEFEVRTLRGLYEESGDAIVCCRSIFIRKVNGIGGMLMPLTLADAMSRAAMMMDPAAPGEEPDYEGLVREAMEEIFNVFVGSWNTHSSPDYRLGSKTEERAVELFPTAVPVPPEAGIFPHALRYPLNVNGVESYIAIFLPIKAVHGREVAAFQPPAQFVPDTAPPFPEAAISGPVAAADAEGTAPLVPRREGPVKPVAFLDYSGAILAWLRERARNPNYQCFMSPVKSLAAIDADHPPAATIIVGVTPEQLAELEDLSVVELRPRTETESA